MPISSSSNIEFSDSLSLIQRCNLRILSRPVTMASSDFESFEVHRTVNVGKELGFDMVRKEQDVAQALGTGLQETMSNDDNNFLIQSMWGHSSFDHLVKKAEGRSGGIMAIWDPSKFSLITSSIGDGFLSLFGRWIPCDLQCLIIIVYAPQEPNRKKKLRLINSANTMSVIMGDFNEVRSATERLGSHFCSRSASLFNDFISESGLHDLPMGGMRFTRMNSLGSKLSKRDRIMVSHHFLEKWPSSNVLALTREFSDHSPL
ncbi:cytochrome P450 [Tanacetum coccineum]